MLVNYQNNIATVRCNICDVETNHDVSNKTSKYMEEFGEYENLMLPCSNCTNAIEGFNMNITIGRKYGRYARTMNKHKGHI